jgi:hypothetical protein
MNDEKTIFIHIGIPKTGTKFLQQAVFPHIPNVQLITLPITQQNRAFGMLQYADDSVYDEDFVKAEIMKMIHSDSKKVLISDEGFSGRLQNLNCINRSLIAQRLHKIFPDAHILLFLRSQEEMIWAHYSQNIKNTLEIKRIGEYYRHPDYHEFLNHYSRKKKYQSIAYYSHGGNSSIECFRYFELINLYKNLFNKVEIILYEDFQKHVSTVKSKLEGFLGETFPDAISDSTNRINKGVYDDKLNRRWFSNKTYFLLQKRWMQDIAYWFYKKRASKFLKLEKEFIHSIASTYYSDDNKKIQHSFPEIGLSNYPDKYRS